MAETGLCNYELQRLEQIRRNREMLVKLGLEQAASELRAPQQPTKPKKRTPAAETGPPAKRRHSRRIGGEAADVEDDDDGAREYAYRDPNDVGAMTDAELSAWCSKLLQEQLDSDWVARMNEDEQHRVRKAADEWLVPFTEYTSLNPRPLSRSNLKSILKQVMKLVSGAGVDHDEKSDHFGAGRPITLGVTSELCTSLRAEAQLWMPQKRAPKDVVGLVVGGVVVPDKPDHGPFDTSNGWLLNHPLKKLQLYCEHLDEQAAQQGDAAPTSATPVAAAPHASSGVEDETPAPPPLPPFSAGDVERIVGLVGDDARDVCEMLEQELGLEVGALAAHEDATRRMIAAAAATATAE